MTAFVKDPYRGWRRGMFWTSFGVGVALSAPLLIALIAGAVSIAVQIF
jgi:hypothetical protein